MIIHEQTLISDEILNELFACDIQACKGACCIEGDKGAPLEQEELNIIEENLPAILNNLPEENRTFIEEHGFFEQDHDGEYVTTCLNDGRCCFVIEHGNGILGCGMEQTYYQNQSDFIKPISCHLYPVRLGQYGDFTALNYHQWPICSAACSKGQQNNVKVYEFVETALRRKFGDEWYEALVQIDQSRPTS